MAGSQASSVGARAVERCNMICRHCGLDKPPTEFYDGKYRCKPCLAVYFKQYERKRVRMPRGRHERSAEVTNVSGDTPRPASVYLKPEAIYHARCEQPLTLTGYSSSTEELHFPLLLLRRKHLPAGRGRRANREEITMVFFHKIEACRRCRGA